MAPKKRTRLKRPVNAKPSIDADLRGLAATHPVVRMARMSLVRWGLSEDEANELLIALRAQTPDGGEDRLKSVEAKLDAVIESQRKSPGRLENALVAVGAGVIANVLTGDIISAPSTAVQLPPDKVKYKIIADWIGAKLNPETQRQASRLADALLACAKLHPTLDMRTAVFLDGAATFLDAQGQHHRAEPLRKQVLQIIRAIDPGGENEGAACNNLACSQFSQRKFSRANKHFLQGYKLTAGFGQQNVTHAAAAMNFVQCAYTQHHVPLPPLPRSIKDGLPAIHAYGSVMLHLKAVFLCLYLVLEVAYLRLAEGSRLQNSR